MLLKMSGFEMFCERCGDRYGSEDPTASRTFARRLLVAVGVVVERPRPPAEEPFLRFCMACRGYSCPACWNETAGFCQTCVPLPEPEPVVLAAAPEARPEAFVMAEADGSVVVDAEGKPQPEQPAVAHLQPELEPVAVADARSTVEDETEPDPVAVAEPDAVAEAEPEPPLPEYTFDDLTADEPAFDVTWDWAIEVEEEAEPVVRAEPKQALPAEPEQAVTAEPQPVAIPAPEPVVVAAPEPVVVAEPEPVVAEPPIDRQPVAPPAPVYRPLEPMGPILPPPPPAPAHRPHIEFDLPEAPPAFLLARRPDAVATPPTLPGGLFEDPTPTIRPCAHCDLPVSAKARFCRRCGSAQD